MRARCLGLVVFLHELLHGRGEVLPGRCYTDTNTTANCDILTCMEYWGYPPRCIRWGIQVGVWNVLFVPDNKDQPPKRCQLPLGAWPGDKRNKEQLTAWVSLGSLPNAFDCGSPYVPGTQPAGTEEGGTNYTREVVSNVLGSLGWQDAMYGVCGMPMCRAALDKFLQPQGCIGQFCPYGACGYDAYPVGFENPVCLNEFQITSDSYLKAALVVLAIVVVAVCSICGCMLMCFRFDIEKTHSYIGSVMSDKSRSWRSGLSPQDRLTTSPLSSISE